MRAISQALLAIALTLSTKSSAEELTNKWTTTEVVLESVYQLTILVDWSQTLFIVEAQQNPDKYNKYYTETNHLLGRRPSRGSVNLYMISSMLAHFGVSYILPHKYRILYQSCTLGFQLAIINNNVRCGVRTRF